MTENLIKIKVKTENMKNKIPFKILKKNYKQHIN